jgi:hypothetical protein
MKLRMAVDYNAVRADLGSQGAIKSVSHYTKVQVGGEDIRIAAATAPQ